MAQEPPNSESIISEFVGLTGVKHALVSIRRTTKYSSGITFTKARLYLVANDWDISSAAAEYFASLEESEDSTPPRNHSEVQPTSNPSSGDSRRGQTNPASQPIPTTSSIPSARAAASKAQPKKKFATLGDLSGSSGPSRTGHGHDDEDGDDDDEDQDFFAGGEKSGLAVQNPDELRKKILDRARRYLLAQFAKLSFIENILGILQDLAAMIQLHRSHTSQDPPKRSAVTTRPAKSSKILMNLYRGAPLLYNVLYISGKMDSRLMMVRCSVQMIQLIPVISVAYGLVKHHFRL